MASLYDSASLVMLPSGVKESKVYSIKPTDGSGDFTFSRGTDTATRVNASGLIEKERSNQLLQSNSFDTTWQVNGVTLTSGQSGYDGTNDAWLLQRVDGVARFVYQTISTTEVATFSVYVKEGNTDWVYINTINTTAYFDLSGSGAVGLTTGSDLIDANIESIGSGWFRVSIAANGIDGVRVYPAVGNGAISGASGANIYIQDAMLNAGLVAQPYIETTTAAVYEGITDNLPRLDYSGGASCPSLLLEPSRTNLITQSEYFSSADWTKTAINVTDNAVTSPEGIANAAKLVETTANSVHQINQSHSLSGNDYSFSVFVKKAERRYVSLVFSDQARYLSQHTFDLEDGVLTDSFDYGGVTSTFVPEDYGNGWYRLTLSSSYASWSGSVIPRFYIENTATPSQPPANNYVGDGTSGIYIYGFQLEAGIYPTSYIPTYGTSASRAGDNPYNTSATSVIGQSEGTLFVEFTRDELAAYTQRVLTLSDGTTSNVIGFQLAQANSLTFYCIDGGVASAVITKSSATTANQKVKLAAAYANNDFVFYVDGVQVGSDSSGSVPSTSQIKLNRPTGGTPFIGDLHQVLLFKTRLTNAELAALTTI
jgi:hypothetical protein